MKAQKVDILGVKVDAVNLDSAWGIIEEWVSKREKAYVCVAPVSTIVSCHEDEQYRDVVNRAQMVTPDGMPVVWLARGKGFKEVERTYGPDLLLKVCKEGQQKELRHFFYGGTEEVCGRLKTALAAQASSIRIVGMYSPPFRELTDAENEKIVTMINEAQPDILWVGLGSPKQDFWMSKNRDKLTGPVMLGVGAAFDFLSGIKPQAPRWMQCSGLEWLFRLCCEPRRLWKRYFVGNTKFIVLLLKEQFQSKGK